MKRHVAAILDIEVTDASSMEFQIAVAENSGLDVSESLSFTLDGHHLEAREVLVDNGTRIHLLEAPKGALRVEYAATVVGKADSPVVTDYDLSQYLRPSRYAESDKFFGFTGGEFNLSKPHPELLQDITSWVRSRLLYQPGSSRPTDSSVDTMMSGAGVCRDFAHLTVALLRAVTIPARLVAVYAPGCDPMDFHAVVEAFVDSEWRVVDATQLAPRQSLIRIATGRDAADTAFLDNHGGAITLHNTVVTAVVDGEFPSDDYVTPTSLA
ncbi:MAG: transglutaminase family protein [Rhodococcus sp. (in: high G+C Gram-positive bacteria)]|uniref:transglutaminase-like domain-containing protein n=1 Tax=Rhodococcus sp. TaxID=1831 RepID=UPI003BB00958